jgi:putative exporter of polyketide antibiotics
MRTLYLILYILAAVCFALATINYYLPARRGVDATVATPVRTAPNWLALGLLAWVLVPLIADIRAM